MLANLLPRPRNPSGRLYRSEAKFVSRSPSEQLHLKESNRQPAEMHERQRFKREHGVATSIARIAQASQHRGCRR